MTCRTENLSDKIVHNELIIDYGVSHHMTGCLDLLFNVQDIVPVAVELTLDVQSFAAKQGSMRLSSNKFLSNDRVTRTMIGTGEEHDGVSL
ncbi:hypothetical protein Tco_0520105 [Tanacetum coccineum]